MCDELHAGCGDVSRSGRKWPRRQRKTPHMAGFKVGAIRLLRSTSALRQHAQATSLVFSGAVMFASLPFDGVHPTISHDPFFAKSCTIGPSRSVFFFR